jgi:hypothetical protein
MAKRKHTIFGHVTQGMNESIAKDDVIKRSLLRERHFGKSLMLKVFSDYFLNKVEDAKTSMIDAENKAKKRHLAESKKASLKNMPVVAAKKLIPQSHCNFYNSGLTYKIEKEEVSTD